MMPKHKTMPKQPKQQTKPPADPESGPVARFGFDLRMLRQTADLSYPKLARGSFFSVGSVHRADQGHVLPSEQLTKSFVKACGVADPTEWLARRNEIAAQLQAGKPPVEPKPTPKASGLPAPNPARVSTEAEYVEALKRLREWSGMSFRDLQRVTADYARPLKASTMCAALRKATVPPPEFVESLVRAIGLPDADQIVWLKVRTALAEGQPVPREPTWKQWATGGRGIIQDVRAKEGPAKEGVSIEGDLVPVDQLGLSIRDWVLVDGQWRSTDDKPVVPSRAKWKAIVQPALVNIASAIFSAYWTFRRK
jgi:hypothetical protein